MMIMKIRKVGEWVVSGLTIRSGRAVDASKE